MGVNIEGSEVYDLVILGGGTGSTIAAWTFTGQGQRVAVIERKYIGGSREVAGSPQFTHVSVDDFRVVRDNLEGGNHVTTGRLIPYTLFTDPELARVGLNEKEAKARGMPYCLFKIPMERVLRARTVSETRGFLKALVEVAGNRILGFTAFAVDAGEIVASAQTAMTAGMPYTALRDIIWAHPTLAEGLAPLFSSAPSLSVDTQANSPVMAHGRR